MMIRRRLCLILQTILPGSGYEKLRSVFRGTARFACYRVWYPLLYRWCARRPVHDDRVLFIELHDQKGISDNYRLLWNELSEHYDYDLELFTLNKPKRNNAAYYKRCALLVERVARARYVFVDDALQVLGNVPIRKETGIYNVWHACGAFKRFGFGTAELKFGADRRTQERYPNYTFCTEFYVSSPEVVRPYAQSTGLPEERVIPLGTSRTDMLYDESLRAAAAEKLRLYFPESEGKKVILYAPTFRGRVASASGNTAFSIPMFYEALSDEYVVICKYHPFVSRPPAIPQRYQKFAVDFTGIMNIEELLCVANICITDYSSLIFEYALFNRPMLFFAYDLESYDDWRGFYYNYDELTPGPVFRRNRDMIEYIRHIDENFDAQQVAAFRDRFMSACDGHVTERLIARVFGEERFNHENNVSPVLQEASCGEAEAPEGGAPAPAGGSVSANPVTPPGNSGKADVMDAFKEAALRREEIREDMIRQHPQLRDKRMLVYFMEDQAFCSYPECNPFADWIMLLEMLPEDIVVVCRYSGNRKGVLPKFDSTVFIDDQMRHSIAELTAAADILVTHCEESVVRCSSGRPVYMLVPEYRWYCSSPDEYYGSADALRKAGIFYESTEELAAALHEPYVVRDPDWVAEQMERLAWKTMKV